VAELHPAGEKLLLGLGRGLMAVKAATGAPLWTRLGPVTKYDQNPTLIQVHLASDTVVFSEMQRAEHMYVDKVVAVSLTTGKRRYERNFMQDEHDSMQVTAVHGRHVIILRSYRTVGIAALKPGTGRLSWDATLSGAREGHTQSFVIDGDVLYTRSAEGKLTAVDLLTGTKRTVLVAP
jgi:outer membrane protein assembly factor BamB